MTTEQPQGSRHAPGWIGVLTDAVVRAVRRHPDGLGTPAVTINRVPAEVFYFCRSLARMPEVVEHLESVVATGETTSRWVLAMPGGSKREWDVELLATVPDQLIEWRATGGKQHLSGSISLTPAPGHGLTELRVEIARGEKSDAGLVTKLLAAPVIQNALRRMKQVLETGEVIRSDASIHAGPHPAQPSNGAGGGNGHGGNGDHGHDPGDAGSDDAKGGVS